MSVIKEWQVEVQMGRWLGSQNYIVYTKRGNSPTMELNVDSQLLKDAIRGADFEAFSNKEEIMVLHFIEYCDNEIINMCVDCMINRNEEQTFPFSYTGVHQLNYRNMRSIKRYFDVNANPYAHKDPDSLIILLDYCIVCAGWVSRHDLRMVFDAMKYLWDNFHVLSQQRMLVERASKDRDVLIDILSKRFREDKHLLVRHSTSRFLNITWTCQTAASDVGSSAQGSGSSQY